MDKTRSSHTMTTYFGNPDGLENIHQILELQRINLPANITSEELQEQGFVTVRHTEQFLLEMNAAEPQIIARDGDQVVGYALVMLPQFRERVPVLVPMFELLDVLPYQGRTLVDFNYYVVGQVCVAKSHRGQGIIEGLYQQHKRQMSGRYDFVVTEIATRNQRSLRAHTRIGFKVIHSFTAPDGEDWEIVLWDWN